MTEPDLYDVRTTASGPEGALPLTAELLGGASGDVFGMTQNVGMGWEASKVGRDQFLILSTQGGLRADDGTPIALGYHTGHWEVGLLVREVALELDRLGAALQAFLGPETARPDTPDRLEAALATAVARLGGAGRPRVTRRPPGLYTPEAWQVRLSKIDPAIGEAIRGAARGLGFGA